MDGGSISQDHCYAEAESEGINHTSSIVKTNQEDEDFTNIEVKLEELSNEKGKTYDQIPWHSVLCNICKIYRDWETKVKFVPPRFAHEQDPDMKI